MSNLEDLLNDVGDDNATAITLLGDTIGTIADLAGGIGAVASVLGTILGNSDTTAQQLQSLVDTVNADYSQLNAKVLAGFLLTELTNFQHNVISPTQTALQSLKILVAGSPLNPTSIASTLAPVNDALNDLQPVTGLWTSVFDANAYWSDVGQYFVSNGDAGYGPQPPDLEQDDPPLVFVHTYALPAYIFVLSAFCTIGGTIDPNFLGDWIGPLRDRIKTLQDRHEKIASEITLLWPSTTRAEDGRPAWNGSSLFQYVNQNKSSDPGFIIPGITYDLFADQPYSVTLEYGAVEKYSGSSSMGSYTLIFDDDTDTLKVFFSSSADYSPFCKFQLRLLKRAKDVYIQIGLLSVWTTINRLKKIVGDPPLPRPNFADWSFRNEIAKAYLQDLPSAGNISLKLIAWTIKYTPPVDTVQGRKPASFRELLNH